MNESRDAGSVETSVPASVPPDRRTLITLLIDAAVRSFETEDRVAAAQVLALLEIADAISGLATDANGLAGEVEKLGWAVGRR